MKKIFLTGGTGVMGLATLDEFKRRNGNYEIRILARPGKKNRKKLKPFSRDGRFKVIRGDMMNLSDLREAIGDAEYILHLGGMVSPLADHYPEKTMQVNIGAMRNILDAVNAREDRENVKVIYIGSVAQMSNRMPPRHWSRSGDALAAAKFDNYGVSKIIAERLLAESGLKYWASLRQTGILHKGLVSKATDPISFHVPLDGVLEWATVEDSARLMANLCEKEDIPESFWRNFYNIGSGKAFRLTNYEFEKELMTAMGCPPPEKVFERNWFATSNFHGSWFVDSDRLEELFHFREDIDTQAYFRRLARQMPAWTRLARIAPTGVIKAFMKQVAHTEGLGTLDWLKRKDCEDRIEAFFGSRRSQEEIGGWDTFDGVRPSEEAILMPHGYDESKLEKEICVADLKEAAAFRGGEVNTDLPNDRSGIFDDKFEWVCEHGHRFEATPRTILKGGHWCEQCMRKPSEYIDRAKKNKFLLQYFK